MKKDIQLSINEWVAHAYDKMTEELSGIFWFDAKRLRSCNAYVFETPNYYVLKSYNTIVACINKNCGQSYDFLRMVYGYTATSAQHISKFFRDYGDSRIMPYVYRDI